MEDGRQDDARDFTLPNGEQSFNLRGWLLGSASSRTAGKVRWSEISIYKTVGGSYVVAGCGRTVAAGEDDRYWAQVCERPQGVIERLHMFDRDGSRYIPHTSKIALQQARDADRDLDQAFLVQTVD